MRVLVTGARGLVGWPAANRCEEAGLTVTRSGRSASGPGWSAWDMTGGDPPEDMADLDCLIHAAPLWVLPEHIGRLAERGVRRLVCFSSTSVSTKFDSADASERKLAALLERSEAEVQARAAGQGISTTIFRPTMIYGWGRDANVSFIARFIRRFRFFPVAGEAAGRRQPVHAGDLAEAAVAVLDNDRTFGRIYALTGPQSLTYRAMVQRIFQCLGRAERIVRLPRGPYRALLGTAGRLGFGMSAGMVDRMEEDLVFDCSPAKRDFGYTAEPFLAHPERDLPAT